MKPDRTSAQVRARLAELKAADKASFAALSRMIRKPQRYLADFVRDGRPEYLEDADRKMLAAYFRVDEQELGKRAGD